MSATPLASVGGLAPAAEGLDQELARDKAPYMREAGRAPFAHRGDAPGPVDELDQEPDPER